jgi:hypothetical protein
MSPEYWMYECRVSVESISTSRNYCECSVVITNGFKCCICSVNKRYYLLNQRPNSYNILWSLQGPFSVPGCCIARLPFLLALTMFYVLYPPMNVTVWALLTLKIKMEAASLSKTSVLYCPCCAQVGWHLSTYPITNKHYIHLGKFTTWLPPTDCIPVAARFIDI